MLEGTVRRIDAAFSSPCILLYMQYYVQVMCTTSVIATLSILSMYLERRLALSIPPLGLAPFGHPKVVSCAPPQQGLLHPFSFIESFVHFFISPLGVMPKKGVR